MSPKVAQFGDLYVQTLQKDAQGRLLSHPDGNGNYFPVQGNGQLNGYGMVGNPAPKFQHGIGTTVYLQEFQPELPRRRQIRRVTG